MGDLYKVWEIKALKRKPGEEEAKKILEKIAKQVQPIWRVKLLLEFYPNNPALLGLNVGVGIHVKLRLEDRTGIVYPFDQVLDTMLHELCYYAYGLHNASFYKLWDEIRKDQIIKKALLGVTRGSQDVSIYGFTIKHYLCGKGRAYVIGIRTIVNDF
ncbi:hypothetical protein Goklo_023523 [Gossypium klotzschianum]|uniref:WLM domain-containing protein n=1 Tax=Gossypium klotzschianum TaxID=34286 RepID=A0A7J8TR48_9ROSI|nr:hypothetical protein [Gossypium klotzschianum]